MEIDQRMSQRKWLGHTRQRVVDGGVAVGMETRHHVSDHTSAFHVVAVRPESLVEHRPQDSAVYRLEAVTGIWQCPADDDRHGVVEEGAFHLLLDLNKRVGLFFVT